MEKKSYLVPETRTVEIQGITAMLAGSIGEDKPGTGTGLPPGFDPGQGGGSRGGRDWDDDEE